MSDIKGPEPLIKKITDVFMFFTLCAALGSIIVMPWAINRLTYEVRSASQLYLAVELCRQGKQSKLCQALKDTPHD